MRVATIYDIHGNLPALDAVLDEILVCEADRLIVGGDVIAGPMPNEVLARLRDLPMQVNYILGNAESEYLRCVAGQPIRGLSPRAEDEARWLTSVLPPEMHTFIQTWSNTQSIVHPVFGDILFCHATPRSNIEVFTSQTAEETAGPAFANVSERLVICGHTHMQFERQIGAVHVINAGSVGMPFGSTGANWLLIDQQLVFKRTEYDLAEAASMIKGSGYPQADQFAENNVLSSPTKEQALAMLSRIEQSQSLDSLILFST